MAKKTFLVIPHDDGSIREYNISMRIILFICLFITVGVSGFFINQSDYIKSKRKKVNSLAIKNDSLENIYSKMDSKLRELKINLEKVRIKEAEAYNIAGIKTNKDSTKTLSSQTLLHKNKNSIKELITEASKIDSYYDRLLKHFLRNSSAVNKIPSLWPCGKKHTYISFGFGERKDPFTGRMVPHMGVDFPAPTGSLVYATATGTVIESEPHKFYGKRIIIDHHNGYKTIYAHLNRIKVHKGQWIKKGQKIGTVGKTGYTTGPHLHYEVLYNNVNKDPENYLLSFCN